MQLQEAGQTGVGHMAVTASQTCIRCIYHLTVAVAALNLSVRVTSHIRREEQAGAGAGAFDGCMSNPASDLCRCALYILCLLSYQDGR